MNQLILCACKRGSKVDQTKLTKLSNELNAKQIAFTLFDDLCAYAAKNNTIEINLSSYTSNIVVGCQPKAMKNLLARVGINTSKYNFDFRLANESTMDNLETDKLDKGEPKTIEYNGDWKPWYPALDYDLCTSCQKCLNFCLFGVYKLDDNGKVVVENPENCKDLCPACARTCPTNAIVFPKHHESPIDGGKGEFVLESDSILDDIQKNQDVYQLLANRRKASGVSLFKADQIKIAQQEREQCACKKDQK